MSWRKKIGWRGPFRLPLSEAPMTGARMESEAGLVCWAREPATPNVRRAAKPPAATPPTTNASLRIIISLLRKTLASPRPNARRSIVRPDHCTTRSFCNPTRSVGLRRVSPPTSVQSRRAAGRWSLGQPLDLASGQIQKRVNRAAVAQFHPAPLHRAGALPFEQRASHRGGHFGSFVQPTLIVVRQGEGDVHTVLHQVEPADLSVAYPIPPGPVPGRPHEANLFGHVRQLEQPLTDQAKAGGERRREILQGRQRLRLYRLGEVQIRLPIGARPSHQTPLEFSRSRNRTTSIPMARRSEASRPSSSAR